jgi:hypothetical protein
LIGGGLDSNLFLDQTRGIGDGLVGDADRGRDLRLALSLAEHAQDVDLAGGEPIKRIGGGKFADRPFAARRGLAPAAA